ncbi:Molybdopterin synthase catalytic subunit MoaE [hydrothermal vent metagenome]|uniref:Molybdopterin synthase catalytic subunit MoaE n=1 Tax=hydrothermal vent metagenome TaxID=652676 RepID=A0A3B0WDS1_9ZZZZ
MPAILLENVFNPWDEIQRYQNDFLQSGHYGATASFVGTMRDFNINESVTHMTLEHYPAMTQSFLDKLCLQCNDKFELDDSLIIHRFGKICPNEPIVLTAAWSAHRAPAFDACRFLMEELKAHAPFWKKEVTSEGERWVHDELRSSE